MQSWEDYSLTGKKKKVLKLMMTMWLEKVHGVVERLTESS